MPMSLSPLSLQRQRRMYPSPVFSGYPSKSSSSCHPHQMDTIDVFTEPMSSTRASHTSPFPSHPSHPSHHSHPSLPSHPSHSSHPSQPIGRKSDPGEHRMRAASSSTSGPLLRGKPASNPAAALRGSAIFNATAGEVATRSGPLSRERREGPATHCRFPQKLWAIANSCRSDSIRWSDSGTSIIVNYHLFQEEYLDEKKAIFKTKNVASFIRQLNLYGFKKVILKGLRAEFHEFSNPFFQEGREDLLERVIRSYCCRRNGAAKGKAVKPKARAKGKQSAKISVPSRRKAPIAGNGRRKSVPVPVYVNNDANEENTYDYMSTPGLCVGTSLEHGNVPRLREEEPKYFKLEAPPAFKDVESNVSYLYGDLDIFPSSLPVRTPGHSYPYSTDMVYEQLSCVDSLDLGLEQGHGDGIVEREGQAEGGSEASESKYCKLYAPSVFKDFDPKVIVSHLYEDMDIFDSSEPSQGPNRYSAPELTLEEQDT